MRGDAVIPVHRAPMRARNRDDVAPGAGATSAVERGLVGIGDALSAAPGSLGDAVLAATREHGEKAGRMLLRFAELPDGAFVWTRTADGAYRLGRISGPWRYDDTAAARRVGVHHVRDADWDPRRFAEEEVPPAVAATFARGGRNLQRIHDAGAERQAAERWAAP